MSQDLVQSAPSALGMLQSSAGSLERYVQAVNRFAILSLEEESQLARKFRDESDSDSARQLIGSHLRIVVSIARNYLGYGLPQADLIQEGNIGLMKAVKRFDPDRGVRLTSYAIHWIRAEMHEFILRNWRLVKIASTKAQRKLFFNLRSLKAGFESLSRMEIQNISKRLHVKPEEVAEMECRFSGKDVPLEPENDVDGISAPIAYLPHPDADPSQRVEAEQQNRLRTEGLAAALGSLDGRSRRVIEARWLREKDSATLRDLATEFKVSSERIRQIEASALQKMRGVMVAISNTWSDIHAEA